MFCKCKSQLGALFPVGAPGSQQFQLLAVRCQKCTRSTQRFLCLTPLLEGTPNCSGFAVLSSCNRDFSGSTKQQLRLSSDYGLEIHILCIFHICVYYTHIYEKCTCLLTLLQQQPLTTLSMQPMGCSDAKCYLNYLW